MTHQSERSEDGKTRNIVQTQLQQAQRHDDEIKNIPSFFEIVFWTHCHHLHQCFHSKSSGEKLNSKYLKSVYLNQRYKWDSLK